MLSVEMLLSDGDRDKEPLLAGVAVSSEKQQPLVDAVRNSSSSVSVSISRDWRFSSFFYKKNSNYLNLVKSQLKRKSLSHLGHFTFLTN